jgi:5'(3')-deoxyribonucleotidase
MKIYIDIDSTLANIDSVWCMWMDKNLGINIKPEDILSWNYCEMVYGKIVSEFWEYDNIYDTCAILDGAKEFISSLKNMYGKENIILISATPKNLVKAKNEWIDRWLEDTLAIHESQKFKFTKGGILIDDRFENVLLHVTQNKKPGILFNYNDKYPWVRNFKYACKDYGIQYETNYDSILNYLEKGLQNDKSKT